MLWPPLMVTRGRRAGIVALALFAVAGVVRGQRVAEPHERRGRFNPTIPGQNIQRAGPEVTTTQETNGPFRRPPGSARRKPPPPPIEQPVPWTVTHYRRGLYFRLAFGVGGGWDAGTANGQSLGTLTGPGLATEAALGWYLRPGLALAAAVDNVVTTSGSTRLENGDELEAASSQSALYGVLLDWYVTPRSGFHVQLNLGLGTYIAGTLRGPNLEGSDHVAAGFGFALGSGYEWWVGERWSMGFMARLLQQWTAVSAAADWTHGSGGLTLMVTASYY